jgi:predicted ATPase
MLADAYRIVGQPQVGLAQLAEAERIADETNVKWILAETLRLRGDLQMLTNDRGAAESSFHDAIAVARQQNAMLFELRSATSLAQLWCDEGKRTEARDLLTPVYGWFTEGFNTRVIQDAKALLDQLE